MKIFLLFFIIPMFLMGCRKPDGTPELRDPIYLDIQGELKKAESELKEAQAEFEGNKMNLRRIEPYTRQSKTFWGKYWRSEKMVLKAQQKLDYYNLQLINRKYSARNSYIRAFNAQIEGDWPSPNQFNRYMLNKRLKNAPRTWNSEEIAKKINESQ